MEQRTIDALGQAVEAGGLGLTPKALGLAGKGDKALLQEMVEKGYLQGDKKFDVTAMGFGFWKTHCPPQRYEDLRGAALERFLEAVKKKGAGKKPKALTPKELGACLQPWRDEAVEQRFVEAGEGGLFRLLSPGEAFLFTRLPIEEQASRRDAEYQEVMQKLQVEQERVTTRVTALRDQLLPECQHLERQLEDTDGRLSAELARSVEEYQRTTSAAVQQLGAVTAAVSLLRRAQAKMGDLERQLRGPVRELREKAERESRQAQDELAALRTRLDAESARISAELERLRGHSPPAPTTKPAASEEEIYQALRQAYREIAQADTRQGGSVRIPELYDRLHAQGVVGSLAAFHALLQKWHRAERLTLTVCDQRDLEPRHGEGIESAMGLLFYVRLN